MAPHPASIVYEPTAQKIAFFPLAYLTFVLIIYHARVALMVRECC